MKLIKAALVLAAFVVGVFAGVGRAEAADYADAGTFTYSTTDLDAGLAGSIGGSLVVPDAPGPFPLLIASHGWSASSAQQLGWAQHYATWGFVVAVPSFPNTLTPDANVDQGIITQLVSIYSNPATVSPAQGKVDPTRIGLEAHSAGGLASTLAAAAVHPGAIVLFDPVDAADAGETAYATLCPPLLDIFADPSACNNQEEWSTFATKTTAPLVMFHVVGSTHCDGENVDRGAACGLVCGGDADPTRQAVYARYATAFFLAHLNGDTAAAAMFDPAALAADTSIADAGVQAGNTGACVSSGDGGLGLSASDGGLYPTPVAGDDGGAGIAPIGTGSSGSSGGGTSLGGEDGGATSGGGGAAAGGSAPGSSSGCGCALAGAGGPGWAMAILLGTFGLGLARRRRQARG